jgi:sulfite reductase beta subunit-like hemoprotein
VELEALKAWAVADHARNIERLKRGEITNQQFLPMRLCNGLYMQRPEVKHMLRIKIPAGVCTADQVEAIADVTDRWGKGKTHVTTRQDFQIHHLDLEDSAPALERLLAGGVTTRGACSDTVRNVTVCPLTGVGHRERFDVTAHALAISDHFLFHPWNGRLPRKFKVAVSGCDDDCAQAMINDIGLFAVEEDGRRGFALFAGGGLGPTPEMAHLMRAFVPEEDVLVVCEAVVRFYHREGERKNRKRNRMKFLVRRWGEAEFRRRLDEEIASVERERGDVLRAELRGFLARYEEPKALAPAPGVPDGSLEFLHWVRTNTGEQKQAGYRHVTVTIPLGDLVSAQLRRIAALARTVGNGTIRATPSQNIVLRFVPEARLHETWAALVDVGLGRPDAETVGDVISCPGADYCSLAITKSMKVSDKMNVLLGANGLVEKLGRFSIRVSGCPNGCGQDKVGDVGLSGLVSKDEYGIDRPYYSIRVGGGVGRGASAGKRIERRFAEADAPLAIDAMARHYVKDRLPGESFRAYVARVGTKELSRVAAEAVCGRAI